MKCILVLFLVQTTFGSYNTTTERNDIFLQVNTTTNDPLESNTTLRCVSNNSVNQIGCLNESETLQPGSNLEERKSKMNVDYIGYVAVPAFLLIGLSGNTLTIIVMMSKKFRHMSVSLILIALALSDTTLILMLPFNKLFVRNIFGIDIRSLSETGCKLFFVMFRSSKMTSSWFVVFLCLERYVAVKYPFQTKFICTKRNACIGLSMVYIVIFSYCGAWTFASKIINGVCVPHYPNPPSMAMGFLIGGTFLYSLIPICILMIISPLISFELFKRIKVQAALSTGSQKIGEEVKRTTTMLLGVSIAYVVLVAPISIAHIVFHVQGLSIFEVEDSGMVIYRELAQILEQLNYSINFFMYVICSQSFRDRVKMVLACRDEPRRRYHSNFTSTKTTSTVAVRQDTGSKTSITKTSVTNITDEVEESNHTEIKTIA